MIYAYSGVGESLGGIRGLNLPFKWNFTVSGINRDLIRRRHYLLLDSQLLQFWLKRLLKIQRLTDWRRRSHSFNQTLLLLWNFSSSVILFNEVIVKIDAWSGMLASQGGRSQQGHGSRRGTIQVTRLIFEWCSARQFLSVSRIFREWACIRIIVIHSKQWNSSHCCAPLQRRCGGCTFVRDGDRRRAERQRGGLLHQGRLRCALGRLGARGAVLCQWHSRPEVKIPLFRFLWEFPFLLFF